MFGFLFVVSLVGLFSIVPLRKLYFCLSPVVVIHCRRWLWSPKSKPTMKVAYLFAPILAFCNADGCGLTDWSLASNYGKVAIIIFSSWVGLACCGVMMSVVSTASDLMQNFKTGYLTLTSPRAIFISEVLGIAIGCLMSPFILLCGDSLRNVSAATFCLSGVTPICIKFLSGAINKASSEHFVCFAVPEKEVEAVAEALQFVFYSALNVRRLS
ncbi:hypothetical protein RJT34_11766 [Clitoria ternatea]|uniref:Uncharacterized protein n=1 Tax=Clitoria ternatea TaxID=43366 RepID=A0AAN9JMJ0_CLITE